MSTTTPRSTLPPEDIDLLVLIERLVLYFRKYKWTYLIAILVGAGLGFSTWFSMPKVYKSRLILQSFTLSNLNYIQVVSNWNRLLQSGEHDLLAETWALPRSSVGKVKQVKGTEIQKIFTPNNPNGFYIDVFVTDNSVLDELENGILHGFDNVALIKKQLAIRKENLHKLISEVGKELAKLDSTKSKVESMMNSRNGQPSSMIVDISGLNKQRIELNEKLLGYQQDLQFATAVQVLQGFSKFGHPAGPRLFIWLGLGIVAGVSIAFVVTLANSVWKRVRIRLQEQGTTS